jgi:hypothetical protein
VASAGWVLTYYLRGVGTLDIDADTDTDGEGYSITVAAASTTLAAGVYEFLARVAKAGEVYTVDSGAVEVLPNAATATAGQLQSHAEQMVPLLEAEIKARLSGTAGTAHNEYTIDGRAISKIPLEDLYALLNRYRAELAREQNGGRLPAVVIRFPRVCS